MSIFIESITRFITCIPNPPSFDIEMDHRFNVLLDRLNSERHGWISLECKRYECTLLPSEIKTHLIKEEGLEISTTHLCTIHKRRILTLDPMDSIALYLKAANPSKCLAIDLIQGDKNPILVVAVDERIVFTAILSGSMFSGLKNALLEQHQQDKEILRV